MLEVALMLSIPVIVLVVLWFTVPASRKYIIGGVTAVAMFAAALLTGFAEWFGGLV